MSNNETDALVYQEGNAWQRSRYAFMTEVSQQAGVTRFGTSKRGTTYKHLLDPDDTLHNFLGDASTLNAVRDRFAGHKAGDLQRVLTNMVASQPCCFNLFAPLQRDPSTASRLFSQLLKQEVNVCHFEIEFTPNTWAGTSGFELHGDESIGDQSVIGGTDADVAVFYETTYGKRGVVLIEFKYIEAEFSVCSSYKTKAGIRSGCDAVGWFAGRVAPHLATKPEKPDCGYLKYENWGLLERSSALNPDAVKSLPGCPFKGSLNQLWRNMLLAERVAQARRLDAFHFWVLSPVQNTYLWKERAGDVEERFRSILTEKGKAAFLRLELEADMVAVLEQASPSEEQLTWLRRFRERYLPKEVPAHP